MIDWLERKAGWLAFPSVIKYLAFFQLGVLGLTTVNPLANQLLEFHWPSILEGEVWRLFSFIFVTTGNLSGDGAIMSAIFAVFAAFIMILFSNGLEERLGVFRTSLYFYGGVVLGCLSSVIICSTGIGYLGSLPDGTQVYVPDALPPSMLFSVSFLFAFATFFPKYEFRLFFILPVPVSILAAITGVVLLLTAFGSLGYFIHVVICLGHYLVLSVPRLKNLGKRKARAVKHHRHSKPPESFHCCEECGIKDTDDADMVFRITADGKELCLDCLQKNK